MYCVLVIFVHNHPSGDPEASEDDMKLTERLTQAGEIVGIDVLDHIIIGDKKYVSLKREGVFWRHLPLQSRNYIQYIDGFISFQVYWQSATVLYTLTCTIKRRHHMEIDIHYCTMWDYKPNAVSLADELHKVLGVKANLVPGGNGIFDVIVDGEMVFSTSKVGRFPKPGEVVAKLKL